MPPRTPKARVAAPLLGVSLLLSTGLPAPLTAQARRPLSPSHWSYSLQEALHALGVPGSELLLVRALSGTAHLTLMEGVMGGASPADGSALAGQGSDPDLQRLLDRWSTRLRREVGPRDRWEGDPTATQAGEELTSLGDGFLLDAEGGWSDDPALPIPSREGFARLLVAGELGPQVTFWANGEGSGRRGQKVVQSAGIGVPVKGFDLLFGRVPLAMGQGTDPLLLNGRRPSAGAFLTSRDPFRLPGALEGLGPFRLHLGLSPFVSAPATPSAWLGSYALTWSPHPRLKLGALRTTRFAGEGIEDFRLQDFFRMLVGQGKEDSFDDSQGELAARLSWNLLGQPLATYLSLGFEDKTTLWRDPALLLGVLLPRLRPEALYTLRYEFLAMGPRARWCSGCDRWEHELWYLHSAFGPYRLEGEPLGALLGGNGAAHTLRLEGWLTRAPIRGWLAFRHLSRDPLNAMLGPTPRPAGSPAALEGWTMLPQPAPARVRSWTLGAEALFPRGWGLSAALHTALLDGEREWGLSLTLRALFYDLFGPGN